MELSGERSESERFAMGVGFAGDCRVPDSAGDASRFNDCEGREAGSVTESSLRR